MEGGPRENEAVNERGSHADGNSLAKSAQHAACGGAVQIERIADAAEICRDDEGLAVHSESDMAHEGFVENFVDGFGVVFAALGQAFDLGSIRRCKVAHDESVGRAGCCNKCQSGWRLGFCGLWLGRAADDAEADVFGRRRAIGPGIGGTIGASSDDFAFSVAR